MGQVILAGFLFASFLLALLLVGECLIKLAFEQRSEIERLGCTIYRLRRQRHRKKIGRVPLIRCAAKMLAL